MTEPKPCVFVIDDEFSMRDSLSSLITSVGTAVKTFAHAVDFLRDYDPAQPGCLVLDVRLPLMSGLDLQKSLAEKGLKIPIIFITGYADPQMVILAMKAGVFDFMVKPFSDQLLLDRIHAALESDLEFRRQQAELADVQARLATLTEREREVLRHVAAGDSNSVVAAHLGLCEKTIEVHRSRLKAKLKVENTVQLVRLAMKGGVLQ